MKINKFVINVILFFLLLILLFIYNYSFYKERFDHQTTLLNQNSDSYTISWNASSNGNGDPNYLYYYYFVWNDNKSHKSTDPNPILSSKTKELYFTIPKSQSIDNISIVIYAEYGNDNLWRSEEINKIFILNPLQEGNIVLIENMYSQSYIAHCYGCWQDPRIINKSLFAPIPHNSDISKIINNAKWIVRKFGANSFAFESLTAPGYYIGTTLQPVVYDIYNNKKLSMIGGELYYYTLPIYSTNGINQTFMDNAVFTPINNEGYWEFKNAKSQLITTKVTPVPDYIKSYNLTDAGLLFLPNTESPIVKSVGQWTLTTLSSTNKISFKNTYSNNYLSYCFGCFNTSTGCNTLLFKFSVFAHVNNNKQNYSQWTMMPVIGQEGLYNIMNMDLHLYMYISETKEAATGQVVPLLKGTIDGDPNCNFYIVKLGNGDNGLINVNILDSTKTKYLGLNLNPAIGQCGNITSYLCFLPFSEIKANIYVDWLIENI